MRPPALDAGQLRLVDDRRAADWQLGTSVDGRQASVSSLRISARDCSACWRAASACCDIAEKYRVSWRSTTVRIVDVIVSRSDIAGFGFGSTVTWFVSAVVAEILR